MAAVIARCHVSTLITQTRCKIMKRFLLKNKNQQIYWMSPNCQFSLGQISYKKSKKVDHSNIEVENEEETKSQVVNISPDLISAVQDVANSMPIEDKVTVQSDLLQKLLAHQKESKNQKEYPKAEIPSPLNMEEMFKGMRIYRQIDEKKENWGVKSKTSIPKDEHKIDEKLFSGPRLGIFTKQTETEIPKPEPTLWKKVDEEALNSLALTLPSNAFEEVIDWTNEGKYWTFPIDNEAGWEEEKTTGFHEHVFLERLISDFPKKGPIRHFMELVITGLSKNPFISVNQKKEHIDWFRDYFEKRKHIIDEATTTA